MPSFTFFQHFLRCEASARKVRKQFRDWFIIILGKTWGLMVERVNWPISTRRGHFRVEYWRKSIRARREFQSGYVWSVWFARLSLFDIFWAEGLLDLGCLCVNFFIYIIWWMVLSINIKKNESAFRFNAKTWKLLDWFGYLFFFFCLL